MSSTVSRRTSLLVSTIECAARPAEDRPVSRTYAPGAMRRLTYTENAPVRPSSLTPSLLKENARLLDLLAKRDVEMSSLKQEVVSCRSLPSLISTTDSLPFFQESQQHTINFLFECHDSAHSALATEKAKTAALTAEVDKIVSRNIIPTVQASLSASASSDNITLNATIEALHKKGAERRVRMAKRVSLLRPRLYPGHGLTVFHRPPGLLVSPRWLKRKLSLPPSKSLPASLAVSSPTSAPAPDLWTPPRWPNFSLHPRRPRA
jgi:hypothetical protein